MFARILLVLLAAVVIWSVAARPSVGAGPERRYVVRPTDTLWSIAVRTYAGDPREGVWRLERRNDVDASALQPGQVIVLP